MKTEAFLEGDRLIAQYMGHKPYNAHILENGKYVKAEVYTIPEHEYIEDDVQFGLSADYMLKTMKYSESWDWLMPVVEKIETTEYILPDKYKRGFLKDATTCYIEIDSLFDPREEFKGWTGSVLFVHGNPIFDPGIRHDSKIKAIYSAVVGFLKWNNTQNLSITG